MVDEVQAKAALKKQFDAWLKPDAVKSTDNPFAGYTAKLHKELSETQEYNAKQQAEKTIRERTAAGQSLTDQQKAQITTDFLNAGKKTVDEAVAKRLKELNEISHKVLDKGEVPKFEEPLKDAGRSTFGGIVSNVMSGNFDVLGSIGSGISSAITGVLFSIPFVGKFLRQVSNYVGAWFTGEKDMTWSKAGLRAEAEGHAERIIKGLPPGVADAHMLAASITKAYEDPASVKVDPVPAGTPPATTTPGPGATTPAGSKPPTTDVQVPLAAVTGKTTHKDVGNLNYTVDFQGSVQGLGLIKAVREGTLRDKNFRSSEATKVDVVVKDDQGNVVLKKQVDYSLGFEIGDDGKPGKVTMKFTDEPTPGVRQTPTIPPIEVAYDADPAKQTQLFADALKKANQQLGTMIIGQIEDQAVREKQKQDAAKKAKSEAHAKKDEKPAAPVRSGGWFTGDWPEEVPVTPTPPAVAPSPREVKRQ